MQMFPWQEPEVKREQSLNKDGRRQPTELWGVSVITQTRLWLGAGPCRCCSTFVRFAPRIAIPWALSIHHTHTRDEPEGSEPRRRVCARTRACACARACMVLSLGPEEMCPEI